MSEQQKIKWQIEADYLQGCNCDYGCPCEFQAPPTYGCCDGIGAWNISKGQFGEIDLDGIAFGFAAHWPEAIHLGNGTLVLFIDHKASAQQRDAIMQIAGGQHGGLPFEIIATTITTMLEPKYVAINFNIDGQNGSVTLGEVAKIAVEPIANPVTSKLEGIKIEHETGFMFKAAEVVSAKECHVAVAGLEFSYPEKSGFVAKINYSN